MSEGIPGTALELAPSQALEPACELPYPELHGLTEAWLMSFRSPHTRKTYRRYLTGINAAGRRARMDMPCWLDWCAAIEVEPFEARREHVDTYWRVMEEETGARPNSVATRLSVVSSWYGYAIGADLTERNPVQNVNRPAVDRTTSQERTLSRGEVTQLLAAAEDEGPQAYAIVMLLVLNGVRVAVVCNAQPEHLGLTASEDGEDVFRTLTFTLKGGREELAPLVGPVADALDAWLQVRGDAPGTIFRTSRGGPLDEPYVYRLIQRLAGQAGIASPETIHPHTLRHTYATLASTSGADIMELRRSMGHVSVTTTQRYINAARDLAKHPTHLLAARLFPARPKNSGDAPAA